MPISLENIKLVVYSTSTSYNNYSTNYNTNYNTIKILSFTKYHQEFTIIGLRASKNAKIKARNAKRARAIKYKQGKAKNSNQ